MISSRSQNNYLGVPSNMNPVSWPELHLDSSISILWAGSLNIFQQQLWFSALFLALHSLQHVPWTQRQGWRRHVCLCTHGCIRSTGCWDTQSYAPLLDAPNLKISEVSLRTYMVPLLAACCCCCCCYIVQAVRLWVRNKKATPTKTSNQDLGERGCSMFFVADFLAISPHKLSAKNRPVL